MDTDLHFTCFVQAPSEKKREIAFAGADSGKEIQVSGGKKRLIELDGGRLGPIDRGECNDLLKVDTLRLVWSNPRANPVVGRGEDHQVDIFHAERYCALQYDGFGAAG